MSLLTSLKCYWDLSAADATITDQHSGLSLSKIGTTTTDSTGGPDGGPCINFGAAAGKYRNASVAKTISYDDGYTVNIWVRSTAYGATGNWFFVHRSNPGGGFPGGQYWQVLQFTPGLYDSVATIDASNTFRESTSSRGPLNTWQMLTLRDTGTTTEIWRNGVLAATSSTALGARNTAAAIFVIGGFWGGSMLSGVDHQGQLAMAGVWNEPLDASQITRLYNGGMGRRYADLGSSGIVPILRQHYAAQGVR